MTTMYSSSSSSSFSQDEGESKMASNCGFPDASTMKIVEQDMLKEQERSNSLCIMPRDKSMTAAKDMEKPQVPPQKLKEAVAVTHNQTTDAAVCKKSEKLAKKADKITAPQVPGAVAVSNRSCVVDAPLVPGAVAVANRSCVVDANFIKGEVNALSGAGAGTTSSNTEKTSNDGPNKKSGPDPAQAPTDDAHVGAIAMPACTPSPQPSEDGGSEQLRQRFQEQAAALWDITGAIQPTQRNSTESAQQANEAEEGLVRANLVTEDIDVAGGDDLQKAEEMDASKIEERESLLKEKRAKQKRRFLCFVLCAIACGGLAVALAFLLPKDDDDRPTEAPSISPSMSPTGSPSSAPTGALDLLQLTLPSSTLKNLENISTPQWKGMDWLSRHPELPMMEEWRKTQLFALATFFFAFEGPNWREIIRERWLLYDVPECFWFSSAFGRFSDDGPNFEQEAQILLDGDKRLDVDPCDDQGRMHAVILDDLELAERQASIPPEFALLTSLSYLALRRNEVHTTLAALLPTELFQMPNLTHLALNNNRVLKGQIQTEFGLLTQLNNLQLDDCFLSGTLPTELGMLTKLVKFSGHRNLLIAGPMPSELGLLTRLTALEINQNKLSGPLPSEILQLTMLRDLHLTKNKLTGTLPTELGLMTWLADFRAHKNEFSGTLPSELGLMTSLTKLNLGGSDFFGKIPTEIGMLANMESLRIQDSLLSGQIPSEVALLSNLTSILAFDNQLSSIPTEIWQISTLQSLRISGNQFHGSLPSEIGLLQDLEDAYLFDNMFNGTLPTELGLLTKMTKLLLHLNPLSGTIPEELARLPLNGSLEGLTINGSDLSGVVPEGLCSLTLIDFQFFAGLFFDCGDLLCGCECSCNG